MLAKNLIGSFFDSRNLLAGCWVLSKLTDAGLLHVADEIFQHLNTLELCRVLMIAKKRDLREVGTSALKKIIWKGSNSWSKLREKSEDQVKILVDKYSLWSYDYETDVKKWLIASEIRKLSVEELNRIYRNGIDYSREKNLSTRWQFDRYHFPSGQVASAFVNFNPKHPVYILGYKTRSPGEKYKFSLHSLPGKIRDSRGQNLYQEVWRQSEDCWSRKLCASWSPSGLWLACVSTCRKNGTEVSFYKFYPKSGILRKIENLKLSVGKEEQISAQPWISESELAWTKQSGKEAEKFSFNENDTYNSATYKLPTQISNQFAIGCAAKNLVFKVSRCPTKGHFHDEINFNYLGETSLLLKVAVKGVISCYHVDNDSSYAAYFMFRSHTCARPTTPEPAVKGELSENCPFENCSFEFTTRHGMNEQAIAEDDDLFRQSIYRFAEVSFKTGQLEWKLLPSKFVLSRYEFAEELDTSSERYPNLSKKENLRATPDYLTFQGRARTFFVSKKFDFFFSTITASYRFAHPSKNYFCTYSEKYASATGLNFYLNSSSCSELKKANPKKSFFEYNKTLKLKLKD